MKARMMIIGLLLIALPVQAQYLKKIQANYLKNPNFWIRGGVIALSGAADGTAEALRYHYASFKKVHPGAKDDFWNPQISWENKKIFGAAWDGFHAMKWGRNASFVAAITIPLGHKGKKRWNEYAFEAVSSGIFYQLGFSSTYDGLYRLR